MNVLWYKRDLRIRDHEALQFASRTGQVLPIYVAEPSIWRKPDLSIRHFRFVLESLKELQKEWEKRGGRLLFFIGEMDEALRLIDEFYGPFQLFTHKENETYEAEERNQLVREWMEAHELPFYEITQFDGQSHRFNQMWKEYISKDPLEPSERITSPGQAPKEFFTSIEPLYSFHVKGEPVSYGQVGGEDKALEMLPNINLDSLSAYLAWGNLSIRQIFKEAENQPKIRSLMRLYAKSLVEQDVPSLLSNQTDLDRMRKETEEAYYERWLLGQTGIPIIDAAMRCARKTGKMENSFKEMIVSFLCCTMLWDWRRPAFDLAKILIDYRPEVHYSMIRNAAEESGKQRIPHAVKTGRKEDPNGEFIKRYVPELNHLPQKYIHEPWKYPGFFQLNYPAPFVDIEKANRNAANVLKGPVSNNETKQEESPTGQMKFDIY